MTTPTIYTPDQLRSQNWPQAGLPDGRWVMCRPEGWGGFSFRHRLRCAWLVFTGRADVLRWIGQPGEQA